MSTEQILPIAGATVGSFIPGVGTAMGYFVGALVGPTLTPPNPENYEHDDSECLDRG